MRDGSTMTSLLTVFSALTTLAPGCARWICSPTLSSLQTVRRGGMPWLKSNVEQHLAREVLRARRVERLERAGPGGGVHDELRGLRGFGIGDRTVPRIARPDRNVVAELAQLRSER